MNEPFLVPSGPDLNRLGGREPGIYGHISLADIERKCRDAGECLGPDVTCPQSNGEGELVGWLQEVPGYFHGPIIHAGAYGRTSVALLDACRSLELPLIEVHLLNIY